MQLWLAWVAWQVAGTVLKSRLLQQAVLLPREAPHLSEWQRCSPCLAPCPVQLVAVKVIDLLPSQHRQLALACQECQLMSRLHHDGIVRIITFYSAKVLQRTKVVEPE
jgi:hypothetical protein